MNVIALAVKAVFPILALMLIGYIARRAGLIGADIIRKFNRVVFVIFLPALIFVNLYTTDFLKVLDVRIIIFVIASTTIVFVAAFLIVPRFEKDNRKRGVMIQGMMRGNAVYIGMPVMIQLAGKEYVGLMALAISVVVIIYNVYSVIVLETYRHSTISIAKMLKSIITNPMIISAIVGIFFVGCDIHMPKLVLGVLEDMGACATPLALTLLGASFKFTAIGEYKKQVFATVFVKLVLAPAVFIPIAIWWGFTNYELAVVFAVLSAPTAIASFTVAQQMGGDDRLASQIVVYTSVASILTIFLWIIALQNFVLV